MTALLIYFSKNKLNCAIVYILNVMFNATLSILELKFKSYQMILRYFFNSFVFHLIQVYSHDSNSFSFFYLLFSLILYKNHYNELKLSKKVEILIVLTSITAGFSLFILNHSVEEIILVPITSYFFLIYYCAISDAHAFVIENLKKSNEIRENFIRLMSHEVRTPLTSIISSCELILSENENEKEEIDKDGNLQNIQTSSSTLLRLLNNILNFSKGYADKINFDNQINDLKSTLKNVIEMMKPIAIKKNLKLNFKIDDEISNFLFFDLSRIEQVFFNLIGNALKFTMKGEINIELKKLKSNKNRRESNIKIDDIEGNLDNNEKEEEKFEEILFFVKDSGIGIEKEKIKNIFEPFTQVDSSTSRKFGGIGLGLNISKQIIDALKGEIHVESNLNFGSIFSVTLSLKNEEKNFKKLEKTSSFNSNFILNEIDKILLCEDNQVNRVALKRILTKGGFEVDTCNDGNEMIQKYKENEYKLIITDYHMPNKDGIEASKEIKEINQNVFIILLTADLSVERNSIGSPINEIISKPVIGKDLIKKVKKIMEPTNSI